MSYIYPDLINIENITKDTTFNTETISDTQYNIPCYVEEDTEVHYGSDGEPLNPIITIILNPDVVINKGDYITIIKLHGRSPYSQEMQKRKVKRASRVGAITMSHIEVLV